MEPIDPESAASELKRELNPPVRVALNRIKYATRGVQAAPEPVSEGEKGMGIAALVLGAIVMFAAIPGWMFMHENAGVFVIPAAFIGLFFGIFGRRAACGVAGIALNSIIVVVVLAAIGVALYSQSIEKARLAAEAKDQQRIQNMENERLNAERAKADSLAEKARADADRAQAETDLARIQENKHLDELAIQQKRAAESDLRRQQAEDANRAAKEQNRRIDAQRQDEEAKARFALQQDQQRDEGNKRDALKNEEQDTAIKKELAVQRHRRAAIEETIQIKKKAVQVNQLIIDGALKERNALQQRRNNAMTSGVQTSNEEFQQLTDAIDKRKADAEAHLRDAQRELEVAQEELRQFGNVPSDPTSTATPKPARVVLTVILKDGRTVTAQSMMTSGDTYLLKTEAGVQRFNKDDVEKIDRSDEK